MINIKSIFEYMLRGISSGDERFTWLDDEHVIDSVTGVELHLYDDYSKITHDNKVIATSFDLTQDENEVLWKIKELNMPPNERAEREKRYMSEKYARRADLSDAFENPSPVGAIIAEKDAVEYKG